MAWNVPDQISPVLALVPEARLRMRSARALHLGGGAARECQQQDAVRIGAVHDQMRDTMRQRVGLARARPRDDQQRPCIFAVDAMLDRRALVGIEPVEIVHCESRLAMREHHQSRFSFCSQSRRDTLDRPTPAR